MKFPSTDKVVKHIVDAYRDAAKMLNNAESRNTDNTPTYLSPGSYINTADEIEAAYKAGKVETVTAAEAEKMMETTGATDIYHLVTNYFNTNGKILSVTE